MDEMMQRLVTRLIVTEVELGPEAYRDAVQGALRAVAKAALDQAERQTGLAPPANVGGPVVRFPLSRRHREPNQGPPGKPA